MSDECDDQPATEHSGSGSRGLTSTADGRVEGKSRRDGVASLTGAGMAAC